MTETVKITTPFITLGQFLKLIKVVDCGAAVKQFLNAYRVQVNSTLETRRGRKLYPKDVITIDKTQSYEITND